MPKEKSSISEEDLLGIIDLHNRFVGCKNWADLNSCIESYFLPLISCESMAFGWRDLDLAAKQVKNLNIVGFVGITQEDAKVLDKLTPYGKSMNSKLLTGTRSVVACDVDS